jgi:formyl-CoA transferase
MLLAGPHTGHLLADMGAEIIKVEAPDRPDPLRDWGLGEYHGRHLLWPVQSRNKKCITLNLRDPRGQEILLRLVEKSDAVVENFRPGTLERWNLGYERMSEVNPGIVLARVSGFGQTGPYAQRAGFAAVAEAMGGLRYINGFPEMPPPRAGISLGDLLAGMYAAQGVLAALLWRNGPGEGKGQVIDVSMMECCFSMLESSVPDYDLLGLVREPSGTRLKGIAPSNIFKTRDGKWMVVAANHDGVFRRLCEAMGRPELADDPRFATHVARGENQGEIESVVADWVRLHDAADVDQILNDVGVISGPIYNVADIFDDPQYRAREMLVEHDDPELGPITGPGFVPKFSDTPGELQWTGPWEVGSHNHEVYGRLLGCTDENLKELKAAGIV